MSKLDQKPKSLTNGEAKSSKEPHTPFLCKILGHKWGSGQDTSGSGIYYSCERKGCGAVRHEPEWR